MAGPSIAALLARIGGQGERQRLDRDEAEVDAVAERLDLVVLVGVDDEPGGAQPPPPARSGRRTGWSIRVVTGSRVTTQVCTTLAPSSASSCQPPPAAGRAAGEAQLAHRPGAEEPRRARPPPPGRGDVEVEAVEVAEVAELDQRGRIRDCRGRGG